MEIERNDVPRNATVVQYTFTKNHVYGDQVVELYCYEPARDGDGNAALLTVSDAQNNNESHYWMNDEELEALSLALQDALRIRHEN